MARHRSRTMRSMEELILPEGWIKHDGAGIPVPDASRPAVMYRIGTRLAVGAYEARWNRDRAQDSWTWKEGSREPMDIVAYRPEPVGLDTL